MLFAEFKFMLVFMPVFLLMLVFMLVLVLVLVRLARTLFYNMIHRLVVTDSHVFNNYTASGGYGYP